MKMQSKLKLASAPLALGVALTAVPAMAQDADTDEGAGNQPIVVTGSRIVRPEVESVSPVTTIGQAAIDQSGTVRVEDIINDLPQTVAGQTAFLSNGASGTATVNLRGLGSNRTLVLVDGRRLPAGDPFATAPDLNQIPSQLIERVEVVTGGASSVYGADAVAGVVNFIMDRDFEGFSLEGQMSFYQAGNNNDEIRDLLRRTNNAVPAESQANGFAYDVNATFGASFDDGRGHVTAYVGYREIEEITQADYDESACALSFRASDPTGFTCAGSSTTPNGTFFVTSPGPGGLGFNGTPASGVFTLDENGPGNTFRDSLAFSGTGADTYNYAPTNYYQRPDTRWTAGFFADYEVSESFKPYAEFQFMDDRSVAQIAFSGTFFNGPGTLSCASSLLSDQQGNTLGCTDTSDTSTESVGVLIGKRLVEGAPRQNDLRHTSYRAVLGARGQITDDWSYDVYALRGNTIYQNTYLNDLSVTRINAAINGCPGTGEPAGCVPLDLFQVGGVTREQFDYIAVGALSNADLETRVVSGYVTGPLGDVTGAGDIQVVLGAEYREEAYDLRVDENFAQGNLSGQGGPTAPVSGSFDVKELFTEIVVPLVRDSFLYDFSIEGGFRYSDYSTSGTSETYKVGVNLAPTDFLKFRGVYSKAVRSPNVVNLFSPQQIGLFGGTDPCAGATPTATQAQCANTGVTAAQYGNVPANPAGQYNALGGGNPNLDVEKADTWTAGFVFEGDSLGLRGFALSVDYFNIEVDGTIAGIGAQTTINQCIATGDPTFCDLIVRNAGTGDLWIGSDANDGYVVNTIQNIGGLKTEGFDINAGFDFPVTDTGSAYLDYAGTYTTAYEIQSLPSLDFYDCIGYYGSTCGQPFPEYSHIARFGYRSEDGFSVNLSWRFFGGVEADVLSSDPQLSGASQGVEELDTIDSYSWFDLSGTVRVLDTLTLTAGVNNMFDKKPPLVGSAYSPSNGNTYPGIYDPVGRNIFVRAALDF